ncbi:glycosyltransferase [Aureibaculum sp. A20]|uniref:Glycosyltransferase n=1 Tax=Aureibaculum flavum TaxID=2795986 RepID=A0ABS0WL01_9FLAO|nr:glycosyltransferase [Aureibaculum flavum]MBJ2172609.1 glycosyltransferase [Aureibaculum flavum]
MNILIVASGNADKISPFVKDQTDALEEKGIIINYFLIEGKGLRGYFGNYFKLRKKISEVKPDAIHAHYGLSGLLSVFQRIVPTVITFHGSDLNDKKVRPFSLIAHRWAKKSIFVSKKLADIAKYKNESVIPCGVNFSVFYPIDKLVARKKLNLDLQKKYILFSSAFNNQVKNFPLAKKAIEKIKGNNIEVLELKGFDRKQVALLMNAVDLALMTSFTEGSPQFVKEAMASNLPVVSVDVGDVKNVIRGTKHCYITSYDVEEISSKIKVILKDSAKTDGREKILHFNNETIANQLIELYKTIIK